ncbi:MAG: YlaI family protein [Bacillaceae bacterium]|nr:YlaI family protein [Bacillaceae bacterium]
MRVKCVICDKIETIDDHSFIAKRLRNRPIHTYSCQSCTDRIAEKTKARVATGKFRFNKPEKNEDDW